MDIEWYWTDITDTGASLRGYKIGKSHCCTWRSSFSHLPGQEVHGMGSPPGPLSEVGSRFVLVIIFFGEWGEIYPLVNVYITMENHHVIAAKIHYFNGHVQVRKLLVITRGYGSMACGLGKWSTKFGPVDLMTLAPSFKGRLEYQAERWFPPETLWTFHLKNWNWQNWLNLTK